MTLALSDRCLHTIHEQLHPRTIYVSYSHSATDCASAMVLNAMKRN